MARDIGDLGEDIFVPLCTTGEIVATRPKKDKNGWDYFLEFPSEIDKTKSRDLQEAPIKCLVQIKSTDAVNKKQEQITLSAILKLMEAHMPTFIVLMKFNGKDEVQDIYLVHIGEDIIGKILKRVRECDLNGKELNESTISIKFNEENRLKTNTGLELKKQIQTFIPNGMSDYIKSKDKMIKSVGFNDGAISMSLEFPTDISEDDLINMSMGLKKSLPVKISNITLERFDIKLPHNILELTNSIEITISILNESTQKAKLIVKKTKNSPVLFECDFDVYIDKFQLVDNKRMTLKNDFLTLRLDFEKATHRLEFDSFELQDCRKLGDWLNIFKFAHLVGDKDKVFYSETRMGDRVLNSNPNFQININEPDWMIEMYNMFNKLSDIYRVIGLSNSESVILKDIQNNYEQINDLHGLACSELKDIKINFDANLNYKNSKSALIMPTTTIINNQIIGVVFVLIGVLNNDEKNAYSFVPQERKISESFIVNEEFTNSIIQEVIDDMNIKLESNQYIFNKNYLTHYSEYETKILQTIQESKQKASK